MLHKEEMDRLASPYHLLTGIQGFLRGILPQGTDSLEREQHSIQGKDHSQWKERGKGLRVERRRQNCP